MSEAQGNEVISYAWSVDTGGNGFSFFGWLASGESPPSSEQVPHHVGLHAFGHIYEYSAMGVTASRVGSAVVSQCKVETEPSRVASLGTTGVTETIFHKWLDATSQETFRRENFNISTHNSVTWAEEASRVLGVPPDAEWPKYQSYYRNNLESSKRLGYATSKGASRHQWIGNTNTNCCVA